MLGYAPNRPVGVVTVGDLVIDFADVYLLFLRAATDQCCELIFFVETCDLSGRVLLVIPYKSTLKIKILVGGLEGANKNNIQEMRMPCRSYKKMCVNLSTTVSCSVRHTEFACASHVLAHSIRL